MAVEVAALYRQDPTHLHVDSRVESGALKIKQEQKGVREVERVLG